jgi:trans-aconitate 2-methyltransferase
VTEGDAPQYTFGDTPLAAERLRLLARVYDESSRAFLEASAPRDAAVALDIGCGPGVTTRLLAEITGAGRTIGIDASDAFVAAATEGAPAGMSFTTHDATVLPLPGAPADVIYCRLLLAHLPDPSAVVRDWITQLGPNGRLLLDEIEWMEIGHPVFAAYEEIVLSLVRSNGGAMYAGPLVDPLRAGPGWRQVSSEVRVVPVRTADAARMFVMNVVTWRTHDHVREHHSEAEIERLAHDLEALTRSSATGEITWGMRQMVYEPVVQGGSDPGR